MENLSEVSSDEGCWNLRDNGYIGVYFFDPGAGIEEKWQKGKDGIFFDHDGELDPCCFTCDVSRNVGPWANGRFHLSVI